MGIRVKYISQEQKPRDKAEQSKHHRQGGRNKCIWRDFHCDNKDCYGCSLHEGGSL